MAKVKNGNIILTNQQSIIIDDVTVVSNERNGQFSSIGLQSTPGVNITGFSTDGTLTSNSNSTIPTQQAVKTYVDNFIHARIFTATIGNTFAIGEVGFLASAGTVTKARANIENTIKNRLVMAKEAVVAGAAGMFVLYGEVTITGHLHSIGTPLFVSAATAGAITSTAPALNDEFLRVIGHPLTTNLILFDPSPDWIKVYVAP